MAVRPLLPTRRDFLVRAAGAMGLAGASLLAGSAFAGGDKKKTEDNRRETLQRHGGISGAGFSAQEAIMQL